MNDTQLIEGYLLGTLTGADRLVLEARLLTDPQLQTRCESQRQTYELVDAYGRKCLEAEIRAVEQRLFTERRFRTFRKHIDQLFNRP